MLSHMIHSLASIRVAFIRSSSSLFLLPDPVDIDYAHEFISRSILTVTTEDTNRHNDMNERMNQL